MRHHRIPGTVRALRAHRNVGARADEDYISVIFPFVLENSWLTNNLRTALKRVTNAPTHAITARSLASRSRIRNRWRVASRSTRTARRYAGWHPRSWREAANSRRPFARRAPTFVKRAAPNATSTTWSIARSARKPAASAPKNAGAWRSPVVRPGNPRASTRLTKYAAHAAFATRTGSCRAACTSPARWPRATRAGRGKRGARGRRSAPMRDWHSDLPLHPP